MYGQRAAPYEALADFSRRLGRGPAPSELLPPLAEAVARGVGAAYARVTLDVPGRRGLIGRLAGRGRPRARLRD